MQKRIVSYICGVPALNQTKPFFVKTSLLKIIDVFKLQACKLIQNSMTEFDVEHKSFTLAISLHSQNTRFSKKLNFMFERPRTRLSLNSLDIRVQSFGLVSKKNKIKKDEFKCGYKNFLFTCYKNPVVLLIIGLSILFV